MPVGSSLAVLDDACVEVGPTDAVPCGNTSFTAQSSTNQMQEILEQAQSVPQELAEIQNCLFKNGQYDEMDRSVSAGTADICSRHHGHLPNANP